MYLSFNNFGVHTKYICDNCFIDKTKNNSIATYQLFVFEKIKENYLSQI